MTFHHESGGVPACIAPRVDLEGEFLMLMALRDSTTARIDELYAQLRATIYPAAPAVDLPRSGLTQARPGVLLFKGGRDASA